MLLTCELTYMQEPTAVNGRVPRCCLICTEHEPNRRYVPGPDKPENIGIRGDNVRETAVPPHGQQAAQPRVALEDARDMDSQASSSPHDEYLASIAAFPGRCAGIDRVLRLCVDPSSLQYRAGPKREAAETCQKAAPGARSDRDWLDIRFEEPSQRAVSDWQNACVVAWRGGCY